MCDLSSLRVILVCVSVTKCDPYENIYLICKSRGCIKSPKSPLGASQDNIRSKIIFIVMLVESDPSTSITHLT